jgi:hypothetical protein
MNLLYLPEINEKSQILTLESQRCLPDAVSTDEPAGTQQFTSLFDQNIFLPFSDHAVFLRFGCSCTGNRRSREMLS